MSDHTVGVDIAKTHLDAYLAPVGKAARFPNDPAGFRALIAWIDRPIACLAYEPTGHWHRAFEAALLEAGLPLARVNPLQARRFAQALGQRAKTDPIDAQVLAQMAAALDLRRTPVTSPARHDLKELQVARDALIKDRTAAQNRQQKTRQPLLQRQHKARLTQIAKHLEAIDAKIQDLLDVDASLARQATILKSIPGISSITAAGLLSELPELGSLDAKSVASLAGLAPFTRQSGAWKGHAFIQGGRPRLRRLLYMPVLTGIRCNPDLGNKYRQLRENGKPPKVALAALMRKLVVLANVLVQQDRLWSPHPRTTPS